MYPCSRRIRAISTLSRLAGISTVSCDAWMALRTRVRKSAMGSVMDMRLPAALRHARDEAVVCQLAQADPAQAELAVDGPRAATAPAAAVLAGLVLGGACLAHALGDLGHRSVRPPRRWWRRRPRRGGRDCRHG